MKRKKKHQLIGFGLSFMDCICCGFGAVILLFVLSKGAHPEILEQLEQNLNRQLAGLQQETQTEREKTRQLLEGFSRTEKTIEEAQSEIAVLLRRDEREAEDAEREEKEQQQMKAKLTRARQTLSDLQTSRQKDFKPGIAGIPVDSEYVAFVIDSSNSMAKFQWGLVKKKFDETLNAYPKLKGIQILSENGIYMIEETQGEWIPDSPAVRSSLRRSLDHFAGRSHELHYYSNPVPGIERAIGELHNPSINMCIYVFGDELQKNTIGIEEALERIKRINHKPDGVARVRIHALGFPLVVSGAHEKTALYRRIRHWPRRQGEDFATLMRELCHRSDGTFVGLPTFRE